MATDKKKVEVRDLKPAKDAKGGVAKNQNTNRGSQQNRNHGSANSNRGSANGGGRVLN
ncbi:MAG: hypothetical protein ABI233_11160 [Chthoniobacterales bacterium]